MKFKTKKLNELDQSKPKEIISIRIRPDLIQQLKRDSKKHKISLSQLIEKMIRVNYE